MTVTYPTSREGLYDPRNEHDSCGIGFVVDIKNRKSHQTIQQGLEILTNLSHRGAVGADPLAGDGAGILIQVPDAFLRAECANLGISLPPVGDYAVGMVFLPREVQAECQAALERSITAEGQILLGWRDVPTHNACLGDSVRPTEPIIRQVFIQRGANCPDSDSFERKLFVLRKQAHHVIWGGNTAAGRQPNFYVASLSSRTLVYKGMILACNLSLYYPDLRDPRLESALALVHQRFSTNTFPSWALAHPFRYLCHNGEINTLRGNINWMLARRHNMKSDRLGADLDKLWPLIGDGASDSATFDNALELLLAGGYSLPHAMMLMVPEAWADNPLMDERRHAFYEYHAALMEPWDGPAAIAFTDGRQIGATLDRNGLRPARYLVTDDDQVIMASEMGVLPIPEEKIVKKWRLQPGKMLLIDLEQGRIIDDQEIKDQLAAAHPYQAWLDATQIHLHDLPAEVGPMPPDAATLLRRQQAFGYSQEDLRAFLTPMAVSSEDPIGSMGRDIPPAVLSDRPKLLADYFKQTFAQVTNPPIDPIREALVMSLVSFIGPRPNLLDPGSAGSQKRLAIKRPILANVDLERIRRIEYHVDRAFRTRTLSICYSVERGAAGMARALEDLCREAADTVRRGNNILILSDRALDADHIAIPALLATAAVHHHLIRAGLRTEVGLVVETGEAKRVHDFCLLAGYGAEAINPYLAFDTLSASLPYAPQALTETEAHEHYTKAIAKGILKVMSKMGISTYQSYCGAQIFEAVGLSSEFIERYFTGTQGVIEGVGLTEIAEEAVTRHHQAFGDAPLYRNALDAGGELAYRLRGERHAWTPETVALLQHAVRSGDYAQFKAYSRAMDDQQDGLRNLRGLFELRGVGQPIPLNEVEPASEIVKRLATGAMSFGSISWEAHTTLALAMNKLGAKSNTGEGGEDPIRYTPLDNGDSLRSAIKQVASGRFGVTAEYLVNADMLQIKMAQGAKPGEGGQLPGHKVNDWIARVRHSTPGVGLISPPPHHDIYSIEDLAQLIFDLKNVNPAADISVKLVSEIGVGTVAAGVAKAHADHVTISGEDGGTGASPLTSVKYAGSPWELGLSETHQTLRINNLRDKVRLQTDGGLKTGLDVVKAAMLGAESFGFGTAPMVALGCKYLRICHLNNCATGVATQNNVLRLNHFRGTAEKVMNFFRFVAQETREIMASLGVRKFEDLIGRTDLLEALPGATGKHGGLDLSPILSDTGLLLEQPQFCIEPRNEPFDKGELAEQMVRDALPAITAKAGGELKYAVKNIHRSIGARLSGEIACRHGDLGMENAPIKIRLTGTAGQSFGVWNAGGLHLYLEGDANDYVGKGMAGGKLVIYPPKGSRFDSRRTAIIGNTCLYGATGGVLYAAGTAGERFAVRNSGALTIVEGVGDHGCEYMTGGVVVVLGETGVNFGAGMTGGFAFVLDENNAFVDRYNHELIDIHRIATENMELQRNYLLDLLEDYVAETGSAWGQEILDDFRYYASRFWLVKPKAADLKSLLVALREAA
ncbi:MAG: glutamate synthase large subunit [Synechococcaceae cyanobacterium SM1_2_3]|nr:glutamate synthase large subunit [Synechococcaceae cyanobacterium SM1_2_3]